MGNCKLPIKILA